MRTNGDEKEEGGDEDECNADSWVRNFGYYNEWAVSLLLKNPQTMKKLQHEIETHAGHDQLLNESNASKIKYLQNIITETLRIYPVAPLLLPHESSSDCNVCGYDIPKGTMLLVNLWTLQKDPNLWADPTRFVPERFDDNGDGSKVCYNMIPFGVGRRASPGESTRSQTINVTFFH
ncbi:cytochrome P450 81C13-like [Arachis stenosperma]|uniref:cytochrome P450 81C13-like n=1 Tax=Arachis stenosperma TaxID=217475 RepID=UPI0025AD72F5|nr:cytochrome P450 81C13-like [Arachis stenosperma]